MIVLPLLDCSRAKQKSHYKLFWGGSRAPCTEHKQIDKRVTENFLKKGEPEQNRGREVIFIEVYTYSARFLRNNTHISPWNVFGAPFSLRKLRSGIYLAFSVLTRRPGIEHLSV